MQISWNAYFWQVGWNRIWSPIDLANTLDGSLWCNVWWQQTRCFMRSIVFAVVYDLSWWLISQLCSLPNPGAYVNRRFRWLCNMVVWCFNRRNIVSNGRYTGLKTKDDTSPTIFIAGCKFIVESISKMLIKKHFFAFLRLNESWLLHFLFFSFFYNNKLYYYLHFHMMIKLIILIIPINKIFQLFN